jgi:predicted nucleic acid-binding protein
MTLLVDTSVWSLALRRDGTHDAKEVLALREALTGADSVVTTGLVLQELLQGFNGPKAKEAIIGRHPLS